MRRLLLFVVAFLWCGFAMGQSKEFMELYRKAGEVIKEGDTGMTTTEISGKMLQELLPAKAKGGHVVGRIDNIRQIKFDSSSEKGLYLQIDSLAAGGKVYEQMSVINLDGQKVSVFKAPCGDAKSEYLILISKDGAALVCDIVGTINMKDIMGLLYGKQQ
jgi:hypothetical protein